MTPVEPAPAHSGRTVHTIDERGFIRDWLAGPGWGLPCHDLAEVVAPTGSPWGPDGRWVLTNGPDVAPLKEQLYQRHPLLLEQPLPVVAENGPVDWTRSVGDPPATGRWERVHTGADGLVDWSRFCYTPEYRYALAATAVEVDQSEYRDLVVASTGPLAVFVGGQLVLQSDDFGYMQPNQQTVRVRLGSGVTPIVVITWQVAFRECRHVMSLRVCGLPVRVVIPSLGADERACRVAEQVLESVAVGPWACTEGKVRVAGPVGARLTAAVNGRQPRPLVLVDGEAVLDLVVTDTKIADEQAEGAASMLSTGESELILRVDDPRAPVFRTFHVATLPGRRRDEPVGNEPGRWRQELLGHSGAQGPSTARALARHALAGQELIDGADLDTALRMVTGRYDCADFEAVGLITLWHRTTESSWAAADRARVRSALLGFKYWIDQPGLDAMCYFTENHQMVWHTAELLAGELFPQDVFPNSGWTGSQHAAHAEPLVGEWVRRKLTGGFSEFDSNAYLAIDCLALVSIIEFAGSTTLRLAAEALLDKVLVSLAANSWRGVHGAAHGRSYTHTLRSARFEETAPIMWLLWGVGALNDATLPATALATAAHYQVPPVVRALAHQQPEQWYGRQVYDGDYRIHHDLLSRPYSSDVRVWRTPDAMLSSVQDYRAGLPGLQEHVWGATLSSEIQVFATHPAASTIGSSARPNSWAGQRILPRVHQDRESLLVLHRIPENDWAGTTHLWFPAQLFDEWFQQGCWLAGRVGNGYVAVAARGGFNAQSTGDEALQCWWPADRGLQYVATVGREAVNGTFTEFVESLAEPTFGGTDAQPALSWTTPGGRALSVSWSGSFTVDGTAAGLDPGGRPGQPPHLDNPAAHQEFGAQELLVEWGGERLALDYVNARRTLPESGVAPTIGSLHGR